LFRRILLGYDGSEGARLALEKAAELARLTGAQVHVVAVGRVPEYAETRDEVDEAREQAERYYGRYLEEAAAFLESRGLAVRTYLGFGKPSEEILRLAQETGADLIVLGTRPHHPVRRRLLGATADKVVDHASCPVLVVK
jgi:nucleotide-binding universal stress UspA family protein